MLFSFVLYLTLLTFYSNKRIFCRKIDIHNFKPCFYDELIYEHILPPAVKDKVLQLYMQSNIQMYGLSYDNHPVKGRSF